MRSCNNHRGNSYKISTIYLNFVTSLSAIPNLYAENTIVIALCNLCRLPFTTTIRVRISEPIAYTKKKTNTQTKCVIAISIQNIVSLLHDFCSCFCPSNRIDIARPYHQKPNTVRATGDGALGNGPYNSNNTFSRREKTNASPNFDWLPPPLSMRKYKQSDVLWLRIANIFAYAKIAANRLPPYTVARP